MNHHHNVHLLSCNLHHYRKFLLILKDTMNYKCVVNYHLSCEVVIVQIFLKWLSLFGIALSIFDIMIAVILPTLVAYIQSLK